MVLAEMARMPKAWLLARGAPAAPPATRERLHLVRPAVVGAALMVVVEVLAALVVPGQSTIQRTALAAVVAVELAMQTRQR